MQENISQCLKLQCQIASPHLDQDIVTNLAFVLKSGRCARFVEFDVFFFANASLLVLWSQEGCCVALQFQLISPHALIQKTGVGPWESIAAPLPTRVSFLSTREACPGIFFLMAVKILLGLCELHSSQTGGGGDA